MLNETVNMHAVDTPFAHFTQINFAFAVLKVFANLLLMALTRIDRMFVRCEWIEDPVATQHAHLVGLECRH